MPVAHPPSTHIMRSGTLMEIGLGGLCSEQAVRAGMTTNKADMIFASDGIPQTHLPR